MRPLSIEQDGQPEWEMESIEGERMVGKKRTKEYLVKWVGYGDDERTWEPVENLENAQAVLLDWVTKHPDMSAKTRHPRSPRHQKKTTAPTSIDKVNLLFYTPVDKFSICCGCNVNFRSRNQLFTHLHVANECLR